MDDLDIFLVGAAPGDDETHIGEFARQFPALLAQFGAQSRAARVAGRFTGLNKLDKDAAGGGLLVLLSWAYTWSA